MKILFRKSKKYFFSMLMLTSILFMISACGDDSNPTDNDDDNNNNSTNTTLSINGDGWSNKSLIANTCVSTYATASQMTVINGVFPEDIQILIYARTNKTGTFNFKEEETEQGTGITLSSGSGDLSKFYFWKDNSGSITISSYGAVGGKVSGTFTGKLYNALTDAEISISGSFNAMRTVDLPTSALN
ncbi:MAG: hypothetical protein IPM32_07515 [Ignavibacteriae bacterium]|nr:hypothetical protein [Ignavibacteriota bacterium]